MIDERANPPRIARMLLQAVLRPRDAESIEGDLLEEYRAGRLTLHQAAAMAEPSPDDENLVSPEGDSAGITSGKPACGC